MEEKRRSARSSGNEGEEKLKGEELFDKVFAMEEPKKDRVRKTASLVNNGSKDRKETNSIRNPLDLKSRADLHNYNIPKLIPKQKSEVPSNLSTSVVPAVRKKIALGTFKDSQKASNDVSSRWDKEVKIVKKDRDDRGS